MLVIDKDLEELEEELKKYGEKIRDKNFLITGGAGFIGSWLCYVLTRTDGNVICMDDLSHGKREYIEDLIGEENFSFVKEDVSNDLDFEVNFDYVFHLAARADPEDYLENPVQTVKTDSAGTLNTLEIAERDGALYFFTSTSEVYGNPKEHPQSEDYLGNVNPVGPRSCYDEGKRFSEAAAKAYERKKDLDVRIVRIFNTYGPNLEDGRAVPTFIRQALKDDDITIYGDGSQTRSFCYITDLLRGIFSNLFEGDSKPYNLGNPDERTILELAEKIKKMTGSGSEIMFEELPEDDPARRKPDISRAKEELGYEPEVGLGNGLKKTIEWFESRGV